LKNEQIKIKKVRLKDIEHFAHRALSQPPYQSTIPISRRRALSQLHNPYGRPDDVVLLVALHENKCIGYQGLLPGLIHFQNELKRIHWSTAFFVSAGYRGAGVAGRLLEEIKQLDIDFPVTRMTTGAQQAYLKAGFKDLGDLTYYQLRMEKIRKLEAIRQEAAEVPSSALNAGKTSGFNPAAPGAEDLIYSQSKKIFYQRLLGDSIPKPGPFEHAAVAQIDPRAQQMIQQQLNGPRFFRGIEAINWMLKYRWLVSAAHEKAEAEPYYFSLVSELFDYVALEIYSADKQTFRGFLVLSVLVKKGRTWVKVLDYAFNDPSDGGLAAYHALIYAQKFSADRLEFPAELLNYFEQNPLLQPLIKEQQRRYLFYPKRQGRVLEDCVGNIKFDYCDADTTFT
jgi:GNAT superfamily N-acetyltransferase